MQHTQIAKTGETEPQSRGDHPPLGSQLTMDPRGAVPLRIAPLVIIGLILLVMAILAATTL
jgi:hypothetical protein